MPRVFVSVLIDTYNHERYVADALSSVLGQDFPVSEREIVVVDDGSTDGTPEVLAKFGQDIRVLRKPNGGQASAFNYAIPQCRGEIISMLDGDDWWAPTKLSTAVEALCKHPSVGIVGHGTVEIFPDGSRRTESIREHPLFRIDSREGARLFRLRKSFLGTSRMSCRAELLRRIGPVPEALTFQADEYIFTLAAFFSDVLVLPEPFLFYRIHGQNHFHLSAENLEPARRKHAVLVAIVNSLKQRLVQEGVPAEWIEVVIESVQSEADMLALLLGGTPVDTIRAEIKDYRIMHPNASALRWSLKCASLIPALFLSPARYVSFKQRIGANTLYRRARETMFPFYRPTHVEYTDEKISK
jgi:glycosyltransferase involved in cell wall biosynthesis